MPGARLTRTDRERIAAGLAEGLGYAAIARGLQRPASTVSREVGRNGGHNQYRADQAHRATLDRSRRRREPRPGAQSWPTAPEGGEDQRVRQVEHRLVEVMSVAGFPRMMAMVLVSLFTSESGVLTVTELVDRLNVSPASISKAVRSLEHLHFIRRERGVRPRRERYVIDEDIWTGVWTARAEETGHWGTVIREAADTLGRTTPAGARLDEWGRFLRFLHGEMVQATERWHRSNRPSVDL